MSLSQLRWRAGPRLAAAVLVGAVVSAACTALEPVRPLVSGPLCDLLPKGSEPGAPVLLVDRAGRSAIVGPSLTPTPFTADEIRRGLLAAAARD